MANLSFNLSDLFEQTFGYKTSAFTPVFNTLPFPRTTSVAGSPYYKQDALGREYFMPVTLMIPANTSDNTQLESYDLPYPIISISSRKTIIETPLTERRGTVKEVINTMDYEIVIKGFIIGTQGSFPEADVTKLRDAFEQNTAMSIKCPVTDIFLVRPGRSGSDMVVIKELRFPPVTAIINVRPYELHLVSDEPFSLVAIS